MEKEKKKEKNAKEKNFEKNYFIGKKIIRKK